MIVVGAGIIGLTCAWRMAQKGAPVSIFDSGEAGGQASWAGAGMLAPGGEAADDPEFARMAIASLTAYPAFVEELEKVSGIEIEFNRCGAIEVAATDAEAAALDRKAAYQASLGIHSERTCYRDFVSARRYWGDAVVNPRDIVRALKVACGQAGAILHEWEPVTEILEGDCGVRTVRKTYRGDGVLIASGAWAEDAFPVRGHLIGYPVHPIAHILRHGHTYIVPREGRLIAGSSTEHVGFDRSIDEGVVHDIKSRAESLLPELAGVAPNEVWNGFRPGIASKLPRIGRIGPRRFAAYGHYRNGILLAPETGRAIIASLETG